MDMNANMIGTSPETPAVAPTEADRKPIVLSGISKSFHTEDVETRAVTAIDLDIGCGEFVAITGASGCGKSTLLSILGLLDRADSGRYWLSGREVTSLDATGRARARRERIGFIFQAFNLISDLSIEENVMLPLLYRKDMDRRQKSARAAAVLDRVGMSHRLKHYPGQLSGGQQQRVAVARALVSGPDILLADEPTGNLDSENGEVVMALLQGLHAEGAAICMVTHDPAYARRADRVLRMVDGRFVP